MVVPPTLDETQEPKVVVLDTATASSTSGLTTEPAVLPSPVTTTTAVEPEIKARGKLFRFQLQTIDGKAVHGEVHNVDFRRGRDIAVYKSDEYVDILPPGRSNNPMSIVCGIFGYKEILPPVLLAEPLRSGRM